MLYFDLALRGGGITVLLLLAVLLWTAPIGKESRLSILAVALTQSAFLILGSALPLDFHPMIAAPIILFASFSPAAITWLIVTIFLDAPGRRWPWIVASLATSFVHYGYLSGLTQTPVCLFMAILLFGALFVLALWSNRDDLVECRCRARPGFAAAIAGLALLLTMGEATGLLRDGTLPFALLQASGTLALALAFAAWLLRPDANRWPGETETAPSVMHSPDLDAVSPDLIARINAAMAGEIWRQEGLTIGALAVKLAVPEHRLRRAINQGLGYRNFSSFINSARIKAACDALDDPGQMQKTVLEIAYDVGFASMGPFNRAFRAEIGLSPTEYRRADRAGGYADSEKFSPVSENLH